MEIPQALIDDLRRHARAKVCSDLGISDIEIDHSDALALCVRAIVEIGKLEAQGYHAANSAVIRSNRDAVRKLSERYKRERAADARSASSFRVVIDDPKQGHGGPKSPTFMEKTELVFDGGGAFIDANGNTLRIGAAGALVEVPNIYVKSDNRTK